MLQVRARNRWLLRQLKRRRPVLLRCLLVLVVVLLHTQIYLSSVGGHLELSLLDAWFQLRGARPPPPEVVIVSIDELTYDNLGVSSLKHFPRRYLTQALHRLKDYGTQLAVFDLVFSSTGDNPQEDNEFSEALAVLPTVIGRYQDFREYLGPSGDTYKIPLELDSRKDFVSRAAAVAAITLRVDEGIVRRFPVPSPGQRSLVETVAMFNGVKRIPSARDFINYYGTAGTIKSVPLQMILGDRDLQYTPLFSNRVALIGFQRTLDTTKESKDSFATPYPYKLTSGMEIHATATANVLRGEWIKRMPPWVELLVLNCTVLALTYFINRVTPIAMIRSALLFSATWLTASYVAFVHRQLLPGATLIFVILPAIVLLSVFLRYTEVARFRDKMHSLFGVSADS